MPLTSAWFYSDTVDHEGNSCSVLNHFVGGVPSSVIWCITGLHRTSDNTSCQPGLTTRLPEYTQTIVSAC